MIAWIVSLMVLLQPVAPWRATYDDTAASIARVVAESPPLFDGARGRERTIDFLIGLAWFESRFDPHATGDHGRSHGLYQQQGRGELGTAEEATRVALGEIRKSFTACKGRPLEDSLGWYAAGGNGCRGLVESRHRVGLALRLFREHPGPAEGAI